jgi:hypothetical protein
MSRTSRVPEGIAVANFSDTFAIAVAAAVGKILSDQEKQPGK